MATKVFIGTDGDFNVAGNWDPSGVPTGSDDVIFNERSGDMDTSLTNPSSTQGYYPTDSTTYATLRIAKGFSGSTKFIGLNSDPATDYLKIRATNIDIGIDDGSQTSSGPGRICLDTGTKDSTIVCWTSGPTLDTDKPPIRFTGQNTANTDFFVVDADVGINTHFDPSNATITIGDVTVQGSAGRVTIGTGVTMTDLTVSAGECLTEAAATTVKITAGTLRTRGSGTVTTLSVQGGTCYSNSTGTVTTVNADAGVLDFTENLEARTVTTMNVNSNAIVRYMQSAVTVTNAIASDSVLQVQTG